MRKICPWCTPPRFLGHVEPLDDDRETHGMCPVCAAEWKRKIQKFKEREKNERSTSSVDAGVLSDER